jgi:hypothetical protein
MSFELFNLHFCRLKKILCFTCDLLNDICIVYVLVISISYTCIDWRLEVPGITFAKMQEQNC